MEIYKLKERINTKDYKGLDVENVYQNSCVVCGGVYLGPKQPHICYECKIKFEAQHQKELDLYANEKMIEVLKRVLASCYVSTDFIKKIIKTEITNLEDDTEFLLKQ